MKTGILIEKVGGCELRLELSNDRLFYTWRMYSEKTGQHAICTPTNDITLWKGSPVPNKRVMAHWDGFLQNQTR